jgi:hypothetical protein
VPVRISGHGSHELRSQLVPQWFQQP